MEALFGVELTIYHWETDCYTSNYNYGHWTSWETSCTKQFSKCNLDEKFKPTFLVTLKEISLKNLQRLWTNMKTYSNRVLTNRNVKKYT